MNKDEILKLIQFKGRQEKRNRGIEVEKTNRNRKLADLSHNILLITLNVNGLTKIIINLIELEEGIDTLPIIVGDFKPLFQ